MEARARQVSEEEEEVLTSKVVLGDEPLSYRCSLEVESLLPVRRHSTCLCSEKMHRPTLPLPYPDP